MKPKHRRLCILLAALAVMATGIAVLLNTFRDNLVYFYAPTDLLTGDKIPQQGDTRTLRLGGIVEEGSVERLNKMTIAFTVTDYNYTVPVTYEGMLPALFREGQGVVAEGHWHATADKKGTFTATRILTKHDESYMPPEVARSLQDRGQWRGEAPADSTVTDPQAKP